MAKATGFLEYERKDNCVAPPLERIKNFQEFRTALDRTEREKQGARCMNCGVPMCQSALKLSGMVTGCPLHNLIPEWNNEIYRGNEAQALARLLKTSSFPEFTGRVCPALCEKACICGIHDEPVTVHENELYIIETAFAKGMMKPRIPALRTNYRIAVIGSGPAGLACADRLNQRGHNVTVFERDERCGGLLMYGIPNMKLDKAIVERRLELMRQEGVRFAPNYDIGRSVPVEKIIEAFDAVVMAIGAKQARILAVDGFSDTEGVYLAVDYLTCATKHLREGKSDTRAAITAKDKHVIIVGGGDTGNDCAATAVRQGASSVIQLEMTSQPPRERRADNPWPEWPKVLNTDYGQQEVIARFGQDPRLYETTVKELIRKDGKLSGVITVKVKFDKGRMEMIEGSEEELACELLLTAAGFTGTEEYLVDQMGLDKTGRHTIATPEDAYRTSRKNVFACGDCRRGQSLVVWAIKEGRQCAREVDEFLTGYSNME